MKTKKMALAFLRGIEAALWTGALLCIPFGAASAQSVTNAAGQVEHWLAVSAEGEGIVKGAESGWYADGARVTLYAVSETGVGLFVEWTGDTDGCEKRGPRLIVPMTKPRRICGRFGRIHKTLTVSSGYGAPEPAAGAHSLPVGREVSATCPGTAAIGTDGRSRAVCTGWTGTGSVPASGTGTNAVFTLEEDSGLSWNWGVEHLLTAAAEGGGSVNGGGNAWYAEGATGTLRAVANPFFLFDKWTGDTDGCGEDGCRIDVPMDRPRKITAVFLRNSWTLTIRNAYGDASPANGVHHYPFGAAAEARAGGEFLYGAGTNLVCTGWTGTGSVPAAGTGTNAVFTMKEDSSITWNWRTNYWISVEVAAPGSADFSSGWVPAGGTLEVAVDLPTDWRPLLTGDAEGMTLRDGVLRIPADRSRAVRIELIFDLAVALDATNLFWMTGEENGWAPQTEFSRDGADAAVSGEDDGSWLDTNLTGPGTLSFHWAATGAGAVAGADFLTNGVYVCNIMGGTGWEPFEIRLPGGAHTVSWEFWRYAQNEGRVFLDEVQWTPDAHGGATELTPTPVPRAWLAGYGLAGDGDDDCEAAAAAAAANGMRVWECYVAGLDPTDAAARFRIAIGAAPGPFLSWAPDLRPRREYTVEGKTNLADAGWAPFEDGPPRTLAEAEASGLRFFRVKVRLPDAAGGAPLPAVCSVTLDVSGGRGASGGGEYPVGAAVTVSAGEKTGHSFAGWTADGVVLPDPSANPATFAMPANDVALKASWAVSNYTVTLKSGGAGASGAGLHAYNSTVTVAAGTKPGYIFANWKADGVVLPDPSANPAAFIMPANAVTLTANWTANNYTVTINGGGTRASGAGLHACGSTVKVAAGTKTGYAFDCWTAEGIVFADPSRYRLEFTMPAHDVSLTANWLKGTEGLEYSYHKKYSFIRRGCDGSSETYCVETGYNVKSGTVGEGDIVIPGMWDDGTNGPLPVTNIGSFSFHGCMGMTSISIPNSLTCIDPGVFSGCTGLTAIQVASGNAVYHSAENCLIETAKKKLIAGCKTSTIPADGSVTRIWDFAFSGCAGLTSVSIPDSVKTIGGYAFSGCSGLTSVTIPESVTSIGDYAFLGCTGLRSVTIPDNVTSIGDGAFSGCAGLTAIQVENGNRVYHSAGNSLIKTATKTLIAGCKTSAIPADGSVTRIGVSTFSGCAGLTSVAIPDSVTNIGAFAFSGCTGLTSVTIPDSVTSIGQHAFSDCTGLTSVTIPDSVTSIGQHAFSNCKGLTSVIIPDSVTNIGEEAFSGCAGLTITLGKGVTNHYDDVFRGCTGLTVTFQDSVTNIGEWAFIDCTGLTSVTIGNGVTSIGDCAFLDCTGLTSVTIPDSVTNIGSYAFDYCTGLTAIQVASGNAVYHSAGNCLIETGIKKLIVGGKTSVIPADGSVTSIGEEAFYGCAGLTSIMIPDSVTNIEYGAFSDCAGLTSVTIPGSVTSIGGSAFSHCKGLTSVTIGNGVTNIGGNAFSCCTGLTSVTIPDSVTSIGQHAFAGCKGLTSVIIPDSVTNIGEEAFSGCAGLTITIGKGVTSHYDDVFRGCTGLTITIPDGVTSIGDGAFYGCTGLKAITIPDSVTSIGEEAFRGCAGLRSIMIPDSVTSIGGWAFLGCTRLTSITIPDSVTKIGVSAFYGCTELAAIQVASGNTVYHGAGNCLIKTATKTLITGCKTSAIPADGSVTRIGNRAFGGCKWLARITIPDSITRIGDGAFSSCVGLRSITIPDRVTSIGEQAFLWCTGLTSITIPDSVTRIEDRTFESCTGLTSVTIPESVTNIGEMAFACCAELTSVAIPNSVTSIGSSVFYGCTGLTAIQVASGNTVYHSAGNCLIATASKTLIAGCKTSTIPADGSVTSIGQSAFENCTGLTSIFISNGVTNIGQYAFYGCTRLTSIIIKNSVTNIGDHSFKGCTGLTDIWFIDGTMAQWNKVSKGDGWRDSVPATVVRCSDGYVELPQQW